MSSSILPYQYPVVRCRSVGASECWRCLNTTGMSGIGSILLCSTEQKAIDGALIVSEALKIPYVGIPELAENDRSATGYLTGPEFDAAVDEFFRQTGEEKACEGGERAIDAQRRIIGATKAILNANTAEGDVAIVGHGGGRNAAAMPSIRRVDQPAPGSAPYKWR